MNEFMLMLLVHNDGEIGVPVSEMGWELGVHFFAVHG